MHGVEPLTVQRASTMFNVQFVIESTLGFDATSIISPCGQYDDSLPLLVLGHFAEGHGDHYVSLDGPVTHLIQRVQEAEESAPLRIVPHSGPKSSPHSGPDSITHSGPDSVPHSGPGPDL